MQPLLPVETLQEPEGWAEIFREDEAQFNGQSCIFATSILCQTLRFLLNLPFLNVSKVE